MKIGKDKLKHLGAGFIISCIIALVIDIICGSFIASWMSGFLGSFAAAGTKEYADKAWGGAFDSLDLGFTVIGGALGGLIALLI